MGATDKPEKEVMRSRIEEVLSRLMSKKHDANVKIKFVPEDEKNKKK
jgi:hypothetical protein